MSVYSLNWIVESMRTRREIILVNHDCKPVKGLVNGIVVNKGLTASRRRKICPKYLCSKGL